jgi:chromate transporter
MHPLVAATLGAAITTWTTFVPCFLWIFLGAPHIEQLRNNVRIAGALAAVTASVVGVVLNLAVWFGLRVLIIPEGAIDWFATVIAGGAFIALQRLKVDVIPVILASGLAGLLWSLWR